MCGRALIYGGGGGKKPTNERYIFEIEGLGIGLGPKSTDERYIFEIEGLGIGILDSMATTSLP
jgi:hypothetical protein